VVASIRKISDERATQIAGKIFDIFVELNQQR